jgi:hypothetical protein
MGRDAAQTYEPRALRTPKPTLLVPCTVRVTCSVCRGYSAPYPDGVRQAPHYSRGTVVIVRSVQDCGTFVSAQTAAGNWINLWTLRNARGHEVGVNFAVREPESRRGRGPAERMKRSTSGYPWRDER